MPPNLVVFVANYQNLLAKYHQPYKKAKYLLLTLTYPTPLPSTPIIPSQTFYKYYTSSLYCRNLKPLVFGVTNTSLYSVISYVEYIITTFHLYSLLGVSLDSDSSHPGLHIDYSRPVADVYRGAAQIIVEKMGRLSVICMSYEPAVHPQTGRYHARHHSLPSWAPDWSTIFGSQPLASTPLAAKTAKASGDLQARAVFSSNGRQITAEGACIAKID
jgi:hypothetical protein